MTVYQHHFCMGKYPDPQAALKGICIGPSSRYLGSMEGGRVFGRSRYLLLLLAGQLHRVSSS